MGAPHGKAHDKRHKIGDKSDQFHQEVLDLITPWFYMKLAIHVYGQQTE